jgi:hypothetical protein
MILVMKQLSLFSSVIHRKSSTPERGRPEHTMVTSSRGISIFVKSIIDPAVLVDFQRDRHVKRRPLSAGVADRLHHALVDAAVSFCREENQRTF